MLELWFGKGESDAFSLQQALMFTQVLWVAWLWTKLREARLGRKRISWQTYLFYAGLALILIGQQQFFYRLSAEAPSSRVIHFDTYDGVAIPDPTPETE